MFPLIEQVRDSKIAKNTREIECFGKIFDGWL